MFIRRILLTGLMALVLLPLGAPSLSFAQTFDYSQLWMHLSDRNLQHFLYDCGGTVDLALKGSMAYTVDSYYGLQVTDCSDPMNIAHRGYLGIPNYPIACDARDHFVYILTEDDHLHVVDVDDHDTPALLNTQEVDGAATDLLVAGDWLYVTVNGNLLRIYSLASASQPTLVGSATLPQGYAGRLALHGDRLVSSGLAGLVVVGLQVPSWPQVLGSSAFTGGTLALDVKDGMAMVGQSAGSRLLDISDPAAIQQTAYFEDRADGVLLTENGQAWLASEGCWRYGATRIYDVSDPADPVWLHDEVFGFRGACRVMVEQQGLIFAPESMCWCAGEWPGFHIFKSGSLPLPEPLFSTELSGCNGMVARGTRVDVATGTGIVSLDFSDPTAPQELGIFGSSGYHRFLVEDGSTLVSTRPSTYDLRVMTRDAQGDLVGRGELTLPGIPLCLDLEDGRAWVGFQDPRGLKIYDVSDPDQPALVGELFPGSDVQAVAVHGDLLAVWFEEDVRLYGIADPLAPVLLDESVPATNGTKHFSFHEDDGRLLWVIADDSQDYLWKGGVVRILDVTDPAAIVPVAELGQLGMVQLGRVPDHDTLLAVPGLGQLTLYRKEPAGPEFLGRLQVPWDIHHYATSAGVLILDTCLVFTSPAGDLTAWPLPVGMLSSAPDPQDLPPVSGLNASVHPNPFNPSCMVRFRMAEEGPVRVEVFDAQGRRVRTLLDGRAGAGFHTLGWDGGDRQGRVQAAGVYLVRITTGEEAATLKVTLTK